MSKKDDKRQNIIDKSYEFIEKFGIREFSTNSFIKYFSIGKSSLYHYFKSKDEIIYEIYYQLALNDIKIAKNKIAKNNYTIEEKLEVIFDFYLSTEKTNLKMQELYVEFISIYSDKKIKKMQEYDEELLKRYHLLLEDILQEEIEKNNIKVESLDLIDSLLMTADGMLLYSFALESFQLEIELRQYFKTILKLIKII